MESDLSGNIEVKESGTSTKKKGIMAINLSNVNAREWFQKQRDSIKPWAEFANTSKFRIPKSLTPIGPRIIKNIEHYQANYIFVFLGLVFFCILTSPLLLVAIAASLGACYIVNLKNQEGKVKVLGRELSLAQTYCAIGVASFPLFWLAGAGSVVFWIIGASFLSIMLHASTHLTQSEQETVELLDMETV
ncbi:unnamed protein product [Owenia fusiformis]|uniref:PRA1 family protein n=1 Tax=Owenia fusiformis TaxID=6347 RepID=A0A8J1XTW9_OWEFU|nr:unnamed protein product [Owenia fusiformis]